MGELALGPETPENVSSGQGGEVTEAPEPQAGEKMGTVAVPSLSAIEQMSVHRAPLPCFAPRSKATAVYRDLWDQVCDLAGIRSP